jgi:hypothetical protein
MEEFDIDIVHCLRRRHSNVGGLTRAYEVMRDVSKDNDFPDVIIMIINVEETLEEYRKNHSILGWHVVSSWSHKGCMNTNCTQELKLFDNRRPTLFLRKRWCFATNH